jgi:hypothetical protein
MNEKYAIYIIAMLGVLIGYVAAKVSEAIGRERQMRQQINRKKAKHPRAFLTAIALLVMLNGYSQKAIGELSLSMNGALQPGAAAGFGLQYGSMMAQGVATYANQHGFTAGGSFGLHLYTTRTDVQGWLIMGANYTWYINEAIKSGEVKNGWRPLVGFRWQVNAGWVQLDYNVNSLSVRFGCNLFGI